MEHGCGRMLTEGHGRSGAGPGGAGEVRRGPGSANFPADLSKGQAACTHAALDWGYVHFQETARQAALKTSSSR